MTNQTQKLHTFVPDYSDKYPVSKVLPDDLALIFSTDYWTLFNLITERYIAMRKANREGEFFCVGTGEEDIQLDVEFVIHSGKDAEDLQNKHGGMFGIYSDDKSIMYYISDKLPLQKSFGIIAHELVHYYQHKLSNHNTKIVNPMYHKFYNLYVKSKNLEISEPTKKAIFAVVSSLASARFLSESVLPAVVMKRMEYMYEGLFELVAEASEGLDTEEEYKNDDNHFQDAESHVHSARTANGLDHTKHTRLVTEFYSNIASEAFALYNGIRYMERKMFLADLVISVPNFRRVKTLSKGLVGEGSEIGNVFGDGVVRLAMWMYDNHQKRIPMNKKDMEGYVFI